MKTIVKRHNPMFDFPILFDDMFNDWNSGSTVARSRVPAVNVKESDKAYMLEMAVPGFNKEDFKIELDADQLTISSEVKDEKETSGSNYTRKEFSFQSFKRSFTLPKDMVDADKVDAKYENGVLNINIPKREEAQVKPARKVAIG